MKDQVMKLNDMGIEAALLGSAATKKAATLKRYLKLGNCIKFFLRINLKYFGLLIWGGGNFSIEFFVIKLLKKNIIKFV